MVKTRVKGLKMRVFKYIQNIPVELVRQSARRAREYKRTYHKLESEHEYEEIPLEMKRIESVKKEIKAKRCSLDQDHGIIQRMSAHIIMN